MRSYTLNAKKAEQEPVGFVHGQWQKAPMTASLYLRMHVTLGQDPIQGL